MKKEIESILNKLEAMHGKPRVELNYRNPLELTVAVVLSAQCTDERVNRVTEQLFEKYRSLQDYLDVPLPQLEEELKPTGFYRNKARSLKAIAKELTERFGGKVPDDIDTFATVKGIGRKSANMIVGLTYGKPAIIVDTHMTRVSRRLGLTDKEEANKIEQDLRHVVPEHRWTDFSLLMIVHGRYICVARKPDCPRCLLKEECDYYQKELHGG
jgi:endonuclease III